MEFDLFWQHYPRKDAKAHARVMWGRLTDEERTLALEAIPNHVKMWQAEQREKQHIPHAGTWLNPVIGRRWEDEIELPKAKEPDWWTSEQGIMEKARQLNITPRPGESWFEVKGRINLKLREAA